ncbi:HCS2 neuropeptides-like isoform X2 [Haliotis rubra]|uniref:HCS2 neuropeptides-like isoform X2 n=1 Tax=Haliotis rubra TaxID=36100 RepID=UPI001EE5630D|nr:HCS2 neuropeptides-like isoform X2 [Haliotis rubra]
MMQLINPRRRMKESLVFLVFAVAGSCAGIFWTNSKDNDYPRIGRRSFYTASSENTYPRIGRSGGVEDTLRDGIETRGSFFTQSDENTFPRIGRGNDNSDGNDVNKVEAKLQIEKGSPYPNSNEDTKSLTKAQTGLGTTFSLPAPILFFAWDANGDDSLSRDEFVNGIANSRKRRHLV